MNGIERLKAELAKRFSKIEMVIDKPSDPKGPWFLDVPGTASSQPIAVEWRDGRGFGVSTPGEEDYGSGPHEVFTTFRAALERITDLIASGGKTSPSNELLLVQLRKLCGISQTELASRLGMSQANVARMERRDDVLLSTAVKMVKAMGGRPNYRGKTARRGDR